MGSKLMKNEATKMIKTPQSLIRVAVFCLPLVLVASCGESTTQNNVINFDPVLIGQATTLGISGSNGNIFRVESRSPSGNAQVGVQVVIDSQYIVYAGRPAVDCSTIPCTAPGQTPLSLPYTATTDSTGTYEVTVIYSWGTAIKGIFTALEAFSGTGYGNANINFTCTDPDPATAPPCPS